MPDEMQRARLMRESEGAGVCNLLISTSCSLRGLKYPSLNSYPMKPVAETPARALRREYCSYDSIMRSSADGVGVRQTPGALIHWPIAAPSIHVDYLFPSGLTICECVCGVALLRLVDVFKSLKK